MDKTLTLRPIGHIRTPKPHKFDALHQPAETAEETNTLELLPGHDYEQALSDVSGFSRIWLLWWFHRNDSWKPMVQPPRGPVQKRGVFATRSPHRPNPLGMSPVRLLRIEGRRLILGPCDLVDGTPVFDIKPYIPAYDAFPDERAGWTEAVAAAEAAPPAYTVVFEPLARTQAEWLATHWRTDFRPRLTELLTRDPSPHRTRRIRRRSDGFLEIGCGAWRARYSVAGDTVMIHALGAGYMPAFLNDPARPHIPERDAQLAFWHTWPPSAADLDRPPPRPPKATHWKDTETQVKRHDA